jgi:hypothetical protein
VGTKAQWQALDREFLSIVRGLSGQLVVRKELQQPLEDGASGERLSRALIRIFETDGEFYVDRGGPWIRLSLGEGDWQSTGVSRSQILFGDPRLAALVLAAVIDYHLHESEARREDLEYVDGLLSLFRQASDSIGREARARGDTGPPPPTTVQR